MSNFVGYIKNKFNKEKVTGANKTRDKTKRNNVRRERTVLELTKFACPC